MDSCADAYCGNYSHDLIKSIKSTLGLDDAFNFGNSNNEVKKALMDAYLKKLQPGQADSAAVANISAGVGEGIIFLLFHYFTIFITLISIATKFFIYKVIILSMCREGLPYP